MAAGFLSAVLAVTGSTLWHGHPAAEGYLKGLVAALSLLNKLLLWKPILINLIFFFFFFATIRKYPRFLWNVCYGNRDDYYHTVLDKKI